MPPTTATGSIVTDLRDGLPQRQAESISSAADHNQLTTEMMRRVAERHHFALLLHEKPFGGVNGSGKHNNWSLATSTGENLLNPGETPEKNLRFLVFLMATPKAVQRHQGALRAAIASSGDDHRLGANEASRATISAFEGNGNSDEWRVEAEVDDALWPLPKYREMLFVV